LDLAVSQSGRYGWDEAVYNKYLANRTLAVVFILFIITNVLKYYYRELWLVHMAVFIAEAALVGGIADWFAVTALFRRPLGFPWHTEIIPRHRQRVIDSLADMIEKDLLSVEMIKERVGRIDFVPRFIDWIENGNGGRTCKEAVERYLPGILTRVDLAGMEAGLWAWLQAQLLTEQSMAPYIKRGAAWLLSEERYEKLYALAVEEVLRMLQTGAVTREMHSYLVDMKEKKTRSLVEKLFFWLGEQTDSINLEEAAAALVDRLIAFVESSRDPGHEIHRWVKGKLAELVNDERLAAQADAWKAEILDGLYRTGILRVLLASALLTLQPGTSSVYVWLCEQVKDYWRLFRENREGQLWLEENSKKALYRLIDAEHYLIGIMVKNVLNSFSKEDLNAFIEEKAGEDLQWIRINGCVVGAAVGVVLFLALHYIYEPLLRVWLQ
jgi:uncharacterized membrane-anchored protein YjiN (DUF445 family)